MGIDSVELEENYSQVKKKTNQTDIYSVDNWSLVQLSSSTDINVVTLVHQSHH